MGAEVLVMVRPSGSGLVGYGIVGCVMLSRGGSIIL